MDARKKYIAQMMIVCGLSFLFTIWMITSANAMTLNNDKPYRVEKFSINTPGNLEVRTSGGHISVEGSENNQVRVEMYVSKNGHDLSPSDTDLDDFDITIEQHGNSISAIAEHKNGSSWKFWKNNNNISISFVVYAPREMSTNLKTSGGHIQAKGLKGNQQIATSGGHLNLSDLEGNIDAKTSGGHIEIADVSGQVNARTSGGHIQARNTEGTLHVSTSGGNINLENVAGSIEASTSGGGISADITKMGEFARLKTSGGNVNISVPGNVGLNLDLHGNSVHANFKNFSGSMKDDDVEGTINGGGPELLARTSGGSVSVSFR